jgi:hypothetical protein
MVLLLAIFGVSLIGIAALVVFFLRSRTPRARREAAIVRTERASRIVDTVEPFEGRRRTISASIFAETAEQPDEETEAEDAPPIDPAILAATEQAIVFRQSYPPLYAPQSRSFFGGLPLANIPFEWPRGGKTGRPLHFVMQLDCAQVQPAARLKLLPDNGQLYLFVDLERGVGREFRVIWCEPGSGEWSEIDPPEALAPAYGPMTQDVWPWALDATVGTPILPRWPFEPVPVTALSLGDASTLPVWTNTDEIAEALLAAQGDPVMHNPVSIADFAETARPWADFPRDWMSVQITSAMLVQMARRAEHLPARSLYPALPQEQAAEEIARACSEAQAWYDHALRNSAFKRLTSEERRAFWDWFSSHSAISHLIAPAAFEASIETGLHAFPETAQEVPHLVIDRLMYRHALAARSGDQIHAPVPARMLAARSDMHVDQHERARTHLLLLELPTNESLGHHFGNGILQFWIKPEDLGARAFDKIEMTNTAH